MTGSAAVMFSGGPLDGTEMVVQADHTGTPSFTFIAQTAPPVSLEWKIDAPYPEGVTAKPKLIHYRLQPALSGWVYVYP